LQIPTDKIRDLIGPGGKTIRGIIEATGVKIDVDDTGRVNVASSDEDGLKKALAMISDLTAVPEVGKTYLGKVVRLAEFGAFVEIFPGTDGLLHISEIAEHRVKDVKDELREGDQVLVKVLGIEGNRIKLSRKALLKEQREKLGLPEPSRGGSGGDNGGGGEVSAPRAPRPQSQSPVERQPASNASTITIEGGEEFDDDEPFVEGGDEPNFNRADGTSDAAPAEARRPASPGGPAGQRRRRHRSRGRGPGGGAGGGGGSRGPQ
jgi:polyribonucleotide nucleotidyltransferase